jgi:hypothetical protein
VPEEDEEEEKKTRRDDVRSRRLLGKDLKRVPLCSQAPSPWSSSTNGFAEVITVFQKFLCSAPSVMSMRVLCMFQAEGQLWMTA